MSTNTTMATNRSTTNETAMAKLGYALASIVLLFTVYQEIKTRYMNYICHHKLDSFFGSFDPAIKYPVLNYTTTCYPTPSTFKTTLFQHLPFLQNYLTSSLSISFTRFSALCFAAAWSTIPTSVVVAAWTQMWNSPSSSYRIRKVHYVVFMIPLKFAVLPLIMYYTSDRQEEVEGADYSGSNMDGVQTKYLLAWFVLFRAATELAFGLGLIWNLYVAHSKDATAVRVRHSHQEEKKMEQVL
ncbi:MAG: hypothetical protein JOS17DRAFT_762172 [Linnemannia elongata]|nr:MAG: hypothetical protein JOS17DRAFT_762172 [Linnemannia elongata]